MRGADEFHLGFCALLKYVHGISVRSNALNHIPKHFPMKAAITDAEKDLTPI